jgi:threonine dehydratase
MKRSLDAGQLVTLDSWNSIADGLAGPSTFQETLDMCREWVEDVLLVSEEGMLEAISFLLTRDKLLAEAAGAAPMAALLEDRLKLPKGSKVVALISGGNQDLGLLAGWLEKSPPNS